MTGRGGLNEFPCEIELAKGHTKLACNLQTTGTSLKHMTYEVFDAHAISHWFISCNEPCFTMDGAAP